MGKNAGYFDFWTDTKFHYGCYEHSLIIFVLFDNQTYTFGNSVCFLSFRGGFIDNSFCGGYIVLCFDTAYLQAMENQFAETNSPKSLDTLKKSS